MKHYYQTSLWRILGAVFLLLAVFGCKPKSDNTSILDGFKNLGNGVYYKLDGKSSNEEITAFAGDLVLFRAIVRNGNSIQANTYPNGEESSYQVGETSQLLPLDKVFEQLGIGDSATVLVSVDSLAELPVGFRKGDWLRINIFVTNIIFKSELEQERQKAVAEYAPPKPSEVEYLHKWHQQVTSDRKPQAGEIAICEIVYRNGKRVMMRTGDPSVLPEVRIPDDGDFSTPLHETLKAMSIGDSISIAIPVKELPGIPVGFHEGDFMEIDIKLLDIQTAEEAKAAAEALTNQRNTIPAMVSAYAEQYRLGKQKVASTTTGLAYLVLKQGKGNKARLRNTVSVHYSAHLLADGKKVDSSFDRGKPFSFRYGVGEVIAGWDEAIKLFPQGTQAILYVPPHLGYGEKGVSGTIPANADLAFFIEILEVE